MTRIARTLPLWATLALSLALAACGGDDASTPPPPVAGPAPAPTPTPTPTPVAFTVEPCLTQTVVPGRTVADLVVPDVIRLDLSQPAGFPNGRRLQDSVVDITLAALFLDLRVHPVTTFASLPLNPQMNDRPFLDSFPFMGPPQGNPPIASGAGSNFNFRGDSRTAFVRVDREGMPAVATALVTGPQKNAFNDANPADDARGVFVPEFVSVLTALHVALADDLKALGLTVCSRGG